MGKAEGDCLSTISHVARTGKGKTLFLGGGKIEPHIVRNLCSGCSLFISGCFPITALSGTSFNTLLVSRRTMTGSRWSGSVEEDK